MNRRLSNHAFAQRGDAAGGDVGALEFGDETARANDADVMAKIRLQVEVGRRRDE